ncbi:MAG: OmpW family outer membrane protein [Halioglobus sp.]
MKKLGCTVVALASMCVAQHAVAFEKGDIIVRVGAANVSPNDSSDNIFVGGADLGVDVSVGDDTQIGLNFAYFLTDRINIEVLAATPICALTQYHFISQLFKESVRRARNSFMFKK